jgi:hypothetical protein
MERTLATRPALVSVAVLAVALTVGSIAESVVTPAARAQTDSVAPVSAIQTPPPVPGIDYSSVETIIPATTGEGALVGSPLAPPTAPGATEAEAPEEPAGGVTANLGGSDVAVSSVGGSYQVDAPGRRGNKKDRD